MGSDNTASTLRCTCKESTSGSATPGLTWCALHSKVPMIAEQASLAAIAVLGEQERRIAELEAELASWEGLQVRCSSCGGGQIWKKEGNTITVIHDCSGGKKVREMFSTIQAARDAAIQRVERAEAALIDTVKHLRAAAHNIRQRTTSLSRAERLNAGYAEAVIGCAQYLDERAIQCELAATKAEQALAATEPRREYTQREAERRTLETEASKKALLDMADFCDSTCAVGKRVPTWKELAAILRARAQALRALEKGEWCE